MEQESLARVWRVGSLSCLMWSSLIYLAILIAFALPRILARGWAFPLYEPGEYIQGSYSMFWLVYVCIPLMARDFYLHRKAKRRLSREFLLAFGFLLVASLASYRYVFAWF